MNIANYVRNGQVVEGHVDKEQNRVTFMGNDNMTHWAYLDKLSDPEYPVIDLGQHRKDILENLLS